MKPINNLGDYGNDLRKGKFLNPLVMVLVIAALVFVALCWAVIL